MPRYTEQLRQILHRFAKPNCVDLTQSEIAAELKRNRSTIHAHCASLVSLGLLDKVGRGSFLITQKGRDALQRQSGGLASKCIRCPDCGRKFTI